MPLDAPETVAVAAHAEADIRRVPGDDLSGPVRVCKELAAHGHTVDPPAGQLILHEIRGREAAHSADRQAGVRPNLVGEL